MKRYTVTVQEICTYEVEVEADSEEAADELAIAAVIEGEGQFIACTDRSVMHTEEL